MILKRSDLSKVRRLKRSIRALSKESREVSLVLAVLIALYVLTSPNAPLYIMDKLFLLIVSATLAFPSFEIRCAKSIAFSVEKNYDEELRKNGFGYTHYGDYFFRTNSPECFHNPDLDECWSANTPLFNINEWGDFIPPTTNSYGDKSAYDTYPPAVDLRRLFLRNLPLRDLLKIAITNNADEVVRRRHIDFREANI